MAVRLSAPGLVCCAGTSREALFGAALRGDQSGIQPLVLADGRRFLAGRAADVPLGEMKPALADRREYSGSRLFTMTAAALEQIRPEVEAALAAFGPERIAVCAGSCDNGSELSLPAHRAFFSGGAFPADYDIHYQGAAPIAECIAAWFGLNGPCLTAATACASSASAIVKGAEFIHSGICDAVIAGGADLVSDTVLLGFAALEAVSGEICNPFSKNRKGITLGEGAAFFLLSRSGDNCRNNSGDSQPGGAAVNIELLGWGESADAHHMTAPRPDGTGAAAAMREALQRAGIAAGQVDYINLHGTGTPLNDRMEAKALRDVFGDSIPPVSSTKPVTGHTLGAAGAIELALCWMTLDRAAHSPEAPVSLPVHCWDGERDPEIPALNFAGTGTAARPAVCMSNSFAFGGCNISLIAGRNH
ncbi:MAG: 3-oxoacyl-ACP synthase [Treponema sp.]|jgi:3-oxoacyl-[acyl-carrier-protein] synthase-1|nr:3-oxoacyl-ACP synthase [Treponema sp.]